MIPLTSPRPTFSLAGLMTAVTALSVELALLRWLQQHGNAWLVSELFGLAVAVGLLCGVLVADGALHRAYWGVVGALAGGLSSTGLQTVLRWWFD